jgi:ATP-dependent transcriptional regulator
MQHVDAAEKEIAQITDEYQRSFLGGWISKVRALNERDRGDIDAARRSLKVSEEYYKVAGSNKGQIDAWIELATIDENAGQLVAASQYYDQVERLAKLDANPNALAVVDRGRATIALYRDDAVSADGFARSARDRFQTLNQEIGVAEAEALIGQAAKLSGKWKEADEWLRTAQGRFHRLVRPRREGGMLLELGEVALLQSKYTLSRDYAREADEIYVRVGYDAGRRSTLLVLGSAERHLGNLQAARDFLQRARQYAGQGEDPGMLAQIALEEAYVAIRAGETAPAERFLIEARDEAIRGSDLTTEGRAVATRTQLIATDADTAKPSLERLAEISIQFAQLNRPLEAASTNVLLARQMNLFGKPEDAVHSATSALNVAKSLGNQALEGQASLQLGVAKLAQGHTQSAHDDFGRALFIGRDLADQQLIALAEIGLAEVTLANGDTGEAETHIAVGREAAIKSGDPYADAAAKRAEARFQLVSNQGQGAEKLYEEAVRAFERGGYRFMADQTVQEKDRALRSTRSESPR